MLEHTGAHIVYDSSLEDNDTFCGFCARPASQCTVYLRKANNGTTQFDLQRSTCLLIRSNASLKYAPASQSSKTSPCSNVPIYCSACASPSATSIVLKYNYRQHFTSKHPNQVRLEWLDPSTESSAPWTLADDEYSGMSEVWQKIRSIKKRSAPHPETIRKPQILVSDAHTTSVAVSYVLNLILLIIDGL